MTTKKEIADTVKAEMASEITPLEIQLDQIPKDINPSSESFTNDHVGCFYSKPTTTGSTCKSNEPIQSTSSKPAKAIYPTTSTIDTASQPKC